MAERPPGVIDTLTAGYETINRRPWILLIPICLDLLFWLGPKLSIVRAAGIVPYSALHLDGVPGLADLLSRFNLSFLLALYVPTVLGRISILPAAADAVGLASRPVYHVTPAHLTVLGALLLLLGLLVAAFYLGAIGQLVRRDGGGTLLALGLRSWWRIVVLHAVAALALVVVLAPWGLVELLGQAGNGEVVSFVRLLWQIGIIWLSFSFFFALDALVITNLSPVRAALSSVSVIRSSFWPAVLLIALVLVIGTGMPIVWRALSTQPLGLLASIAGNAYIGSGLVAAGMLFYRDRLHFNTSLARSPLGNN